ncbi:lamin tail domain-containing protein [Streptomyces sp. NPDC006923]|uniref:lamin tail domain-containing protein n=1 Tax=Streptomyces sp. NPDC006923 TaxID=3155355 RepID=UPI0033D56AAB
MFSSASRATAVALGSAALVATAILPASAAGQSSTPHPHRSPVVLGHVQYDSPGREDGSNRSLNGEWVTVRNTGWNAVNLRGWTLSDNNRRVYRFKNLRLAGKQSVRVRTGIGRDTSRDVYQDSRRYVWDNRDSVTLRNDRGRVVDSQRWGHRYR